MIEGLTSEGTRPMTMQEVFQAAFDRAVAGLASQGFERSMNADGLLCRYSGVGGRHCAYYYVKPHSCYGSIDQAFSDHLITLMERLSRFDRAQLRQEIECLASEVILDNGRSTGEVEVSDDYP